ncbi:MAG: hypothetical protein KF773_39710 [Deltaproteobacteria bacterium]|nr:hypothetical protein [Deltaproteobacteria bacterium]
MFKPGFVAVVGLALFACGKDDPPGGTVDAPATPSDTPALPAAMLGTWREVPLFPKPPENRATLELTADGVYRIDDRGTIKTATWTADATDITVTEPGMTVRTKYLVDDTHLVEDALFPMGAVDGILGTWVGESTRNGDHAVSTIVLGADMTGSLTNVRATRTDVFTGTWELTPDHIVMRLTHPDSPTPFSFFTNSLPGIVLGQKIWTREP